ncbi:MAG: hypothetical protein AB8B52_09135 [Winogradskyella sp.]|uniref:hypothetical protein n=1 Tax=Winogradskyella sp. TaxID=1883156 RepID=UPI00385B5990
MTQAEFLELHVFNNLENLNDGFDTEITHCFSETDFETVLKRTQHLGIGLYTMNAYAEGESFDVASHEAYKKKATDAKWYTKAFFDFKKRQDGLVYGATYKVSKKLLERS